MMNIITPNENETYNEYITRILVSRDNDKDKDNYQERHHIVPRSWGGENSLDNLIYLYPEEHFYAHKLLALENLEDTSMQCAWWMMGRKNKNGGTYATPEEYALARNNFIKSFSGPNNPNYQTTRVNGENNPMYGKHCSDHCKALLSEQLSGGKNPAAKRVRCIETNEVFECMNDAGEWCGLGGKRPGGTIGACISGKQKSAGKHPITGEKLHWVYVE